MRSPSFSFPVCCTRFFVVSLFWFVQDGWKKLVHMIFEILYTVFIQYIYTDQKCAWLYPQNRNPSTLTPPKVIGFNLPPKGGHQTQKLNVCNGVSFSTEHVQSIFIFRSFFSGVVKPVIYRESIVGCRQPTFMACAG